MNNKSGLCVYFGHDIDLSDEANEERMRAIMNGEECIMKCERCDREFDLGMFLDEDLVS